LILYLSVILSGAIAESKNPGTNMDKA